MGLITRRPGVARYRRHRREHHVQRALPQRTKQAKSLNPDGPVGALSVPLITGAILEAVLPLRTPNAPRGGWFRLAIGFFRRQGGRLATPGYWHWGTARHRRWPFPDPGSREAATAYDRGAAKRGARLYSGAGRARQSRRNRAN